MAQAGQAPAIAKRTKRAKRTPRRRPPPPRRSSRGKKFFLCMLFILAIALAYHFAGDRIFPRGYAIPLEDGEIMVSFIDVGQGDSILIRSRDNAVLIDGGEHSARNVVRNYLRNAGVQRLCYVVATHPHSDHIGGLVAVLGTVEVGSVVMPDVEHNTPTFENFLTAIENNDIPITIPQPRDILRAGIINLVVVAPPNPHPSPQGNLNNASIVLRLMHGQRSFLFTGDADAELEAWMVQSGINLSADVLKIGHHGSRTSTTEIFLDAVNPSTAVISLGANNRHGHPHQEVIDRLNERSISILRTDQQGTIRMLSNGTDIFMR